MRTEASVTVPNEAEQKLGHAPIPRLAASLALPAVIAQTANALYTIIDRLFISHIPGTGSLAMTAVGVCFPVALVLSAVAALIGMGGAPLASIELGRGNFKRAERLLGTCTATLIVASIVLIVVFEVIKEPVLIAFGASPETLGYASSFIGTYLLGTLFVQLALGLNPFVSAQGKAGVAMGATLIGALSSIGLDPLFIFTLNLGVRGAAIANVIAQALSALWICYFLMSGRSGIRLRPTLIRFDRLLVPALALGLSPFIQQITESVINVVFNSSLQHYGGDKYVGAMTIIASLEQLVFIFSSGISQGVQPIIGYNYGARNFTRVRKAYHIVFVANVVVTSAASGICILMPGTFAALFTSDPTITGIVVRMLPLFMCGFGVFGLQNAVQCVFVGIGQAKPSLFLALWRKIILLVPLALILPHFLGVTGVFAAEPLSDVTSALTAVLLFRHVTRKLIPSENRWRSSASLARL
jgi:putative MATE family efflux protein